MLGFDGGLVAGIHGPLQAPEMSLHGAPQAPVLEPLPLGARDSLAL